MDRMELDVVLERVSLKNRIKDHRIKDQGSRIKDQGSRIKDQGSVQNESNKLNKLIGMIDCSST